MPASETSARWLRKAEREVALAREADDPEVRLGHVKNTVHDSERAVFMLLEKRMYVKYANRCPGKDHGKLAYVTQEPDGRKQNHSRGTPIERGGGVGGVTARALASDDPVEEEAGLGCERLREARNPVVYGRDDDGRIPPDLEEAQAVYEEAAETVGRLDWDITEDEAIFWRKLMTEMMAREEARKAEKTERRDRRAQA